jgi:hypothetical protein
MNAYALLGLVKPRVKNWAKNQKFRTAMNNEIIEGVQRLGGSARLLRGGSVLTINDELSLSTSVVRRVTTEHGDKRWIFGYKTRRRPDILIVARAAADRDALRDYFFMPYLLIGRNWLTFSEGKESCLKPFQMASISPLLEYFARVPIGSSAQAECPSLALPCAVVAAAEVATAWPSAGVETAIAQIVDRVRGIMTARDFNDFLLSHGVHTMPRLLLTPASAGIQQAKTYGASMLEFAVVWGFVSRLMANSEIASHLQHFWPAFSSDIKMTYLSVLTQGPLAKLPTAVSFAD